MCACARTCSCGCVCVCVYVCVCVCVCVCFGEEGGGAALRTAGRRIQAATGPPWGCWRACRCGRVQGAVCVRGGGGGSWPRAWAGCMGRPLYLSIYALFNPKTTLHECWRWHRGILTGHSSHPGGQTGHSYVILFHCTPSCCPTLSLSLVVEPQSFDHGLFCCGRLARQCKLRAAWAAKRGPINCNFELAKPARARLRKLGNTD